MLRPQQMSAHPEEILHRAVDRREALQMDRRFEAPHLTLTERRRVSDLIEEYRAALRRQS